MTGHTGFKGAWLTLWLTSLGVEVRGYALAPESTPNMYAALALDGMCDSLIADIGEHERLTRALREFRPDIAIHMAAQSLVRRSYLKPAETFAVNVQGTVNFLDACRHVNSLRASIVVTTDKCYENREWLWAYREDDPLGGHDPYSASKACAELAAQAYRRSFFSDRQSGAVATARSGNVFGGGDWSEDRIIPDAVRAFSSGKPLAVRNPQAVRPWQHVIYPLAGYLMLARALYEEGADFATAFNFGPPADRHLPVRSIVEKVIKSWGYRASWQDCSNPEAPHEAGMLVLDPTRARHKLGWAPEDDITRSIAVTIDWYKAFYRRVGANHLRQLTMQQITDLASPAPASDPAKKVDRT